MGFVPNIQFPTSSTSEEYVILSIIEMPTSLAKNRSLMIPLGPHSAHQSLVLGLHTVAQIPLIFATTVTLPKWVVPKANFPLFPPLRNL